MWETSERAPAPLPVSRDRESARAVLGSCGTAAELLTLSPGRPGSSRSLAAEVRRRHRSLPQRCLRAHGEPLSKGRRRCAGTLQTLQAWAGTRCLGRCGEGFGFVAETAGSSAALSHEALRGAGPARRAQLQLGGQFSVMFLLGVFRMPMVSGGKIHACEVLLLSPSLCVILSLSGI